MQPMLETSEKIESPSSESVTKNEQPSPLGLWQAIREALQGSHRDYTEGHIGSAILVLAIPMVLEMAMESVFAVVDVFFVGQLGANAIATVGLTESLMTLVYTLGFGLSIGATALVARRTGERNPEGAATAAAQALLLGGVISIALGGIGVIFAGDLLRLMGASEDVITTGLGYTQLMLGGNIVILMLFLANAIFRGAGNGTIAMHALWLANVINIILCPILVKGIGPIPSLGVTGAAVATTIGRGVGATFVLWRLMSGYGRVHVQVKHWRLDLEVMKSILRLSLSATFQVFIGMASWIGLVRIVSTFGSQAVAGYTIGMRLVMFALLPSLGMSHAAATMVGQALGAKNPERAEKAVWMTGFYNMCFLGVVSLAFIFLPGWIVANFSSDPVVIAYATEGLRTVAYGFLFYAYGMVLTQAFNGAGDTWTPTVLNLFAFWLLELPAAYFFAVATGMGPSGVFLAIMLAFSALAVMSIFVFRKGRWKTKAI